MVTELSVYFSKFHDSLVNEIVHVNKQKKSKQKLLFGAGEMVEVLAGTVKILFVECVMHMETVNRQGSNTEPRSALECGEQVCHVEVKVSVFGNRERIRPCVVGSGS